jgi:hypothetical protein
MDVRRCLAVVGTLRLSDLLLGWQVLLKGYEESKFSSSPSFTAEVTLLKLCQALKVEPAVFAEPSNQPKTFREAVQLFKEGREPILYSHLWASVHLVRFAIGHIEINPNEDAPRDLAFRTGSRLTEWTGRKWLITISSEKGEPTLAEQEEEGKVEATKLPLVAAVLAAFPDATVELVRDLWIDGPSAVDDLGEFANLGELDEGGREDE